MKETILFDAITHLSDVYVEEAAPPYQKPTPWKTAGWLAASIALVISLTLALPYLPFPANHADSSAPKEEPPLSDAADCAPELEAAPEYLVEPEAEETLDYSCKEELSPDSTISMEGSDHIIFTQDGDLCHLKNTSSQSEDIILTCQGHQVTFTDEDGNALPAAYDGEATILPLTLAPLECLTISASFATKPQ